jgi:hypothetical protein
MSDTSDDSDVTACCCSCERRGETDGLCPEMARGIKGAAVYTDEGVGDNRVALSIKLVRGAVYEELVDGLEAVLAMGTDEAIRDAALLTFLARDVRGGKGERDVFYALFDVLYKWNKGFAESLMEFIPEYGSWYDIFHMAYTDTEMREALLNVAKAQLEKDEALIALNPESHISLLAKWAPREGKKYREVADAFALLLYGKGIKYSKRMRLYRKRLSRLNASLATVETMECDGRWDEIVPAHVPGRAREIKKKAYLNEMTSRELKRSKRSEGDSVRHPNNATRMKCRENFQAFFSDAAAGKAKMTGMQTVYPHEVVRKMGEGGALLSVDEKNSLNALWDQMVEAIAKKGGLGSSLMLCDFSGSMQSCSRVRDTPYYVSMAMGIIGASLSSEPFKGRFLTFDESPTWMQLPRTASTLYMKLNYIKNTAKGQGYSTDLQKAVDMILEELIRTKAAPGTSPKNLIIVTDMGFDEACPFKEEGSKLSGNPYSVLARTHEKQTHVQMIREGFRDASEKVHGNADAWPAPRIVIWNVAASYSDNHQASANEEGVVTLSGWSPSVFKVLCEEGPQPMTPFQGLRAELDAARYRVIRERVELWQMGGWRGVL